jgi:hypothetical protein
MINSIAFLLTSQSGLHVALAANASLSNSLRTHNHCSQPASSIYSNSMNGYTYFLPSFSCSGEGFAVMHALPFPFPCRMS